MCQRFGVSAAELVVGLAVWGAAGWLAPPAAAANAGAAIAAPARAGYDAAGAKAIFRKRCTGCHTYGKGVKVGPDLKGVTERRERPWLRSFVRASSQMIRSGDPKAVTLFNRFKQERMPDWTDLSPAQIESILDYFAADGPAQKEPDERHANTASAAEIARGRQLFQGQARLAAGERACVTCHSLRGDGAAPGGSLGPDLTGAYFQYQDKALTDFLKHPSPLHTSQVAGMPFLTPEESFEIKAYMAKAAGLAISGQAPAAEAATGANTNTVSSTLRVIKRAYR